MSLGRQTDRFHDLVSERLPLGIPQREQVADEAEAVQDVGYLPYDRHPEPDRLAGLFGHHLELDHALADALTSGALLVAPVPDRVRHYKDVRDDINYRPDGRTTARAG